MDLAVRSENATAAPASRRDRIDAAGKFLGLARQNKFLSPKGKKQIFGGSGGRIRTADTRIMIPLLAVESITNCVLALHPSAWLGARLTPRHSDHGLDRAISSPPYWSEDLHAPRACV